MLLHKYKNLNWNLGKWNLLDSCYTKHIGALVKKWYRCIWSIMSVFKQQAYIKFRVILSKIVELAFWHVLHSNVETTICMFTDCSDLVGRYVYLTSSYYLHTIYTIYNHLSYNIKVLYVSNFKRTKLMHKITKLHPNNFEKGKPSYASLKWP